MKTITFLFLLVSQIGFGQTLSLPEPKSRLEISLNAGYAPDNAFDREPWRGGFIRSSLSLLKTSGNIQYGLSIEGGTNSNDHWYFTPGIIVNHKFPGRQTYFYSGAMAGYVCSGDMLGNPGRKNSLSQGYVLGLQGGWVKPIGKRMSFNAELALRSTQVWIPPFDDQMKPAKDFILYLPVTVGLRYLL